MIRALLESAPGKHTLSMCTERCLIHVSSSSPACHIRFSNDGWCCLVRNSINNRKSQPGILRDLTTDHSDGQWELSDLWTKRKQNLLCIQENVFVSQGIYFLDGSWHRKCCLRGEGERGFLEGVAGWVLRSTGTRVPTEEARQVLFPHSHHLTSAWRADRSLITQQAGSKLLRAEGGNSALSWAPLLTNLSSLNQVVSHWNNWMERNLCPRKQVDPDGVAHGIKWQ